ncbi:uncharacterized protein LOC124338356 [Daphnia pulicaria]|uniref:uncharacterized protein LOC124338356 n=1 Tax=Daphnia pulicaria TaxID=35523 RepID=UPI001EEB1961|nr:uncharacterized protein LOC124338356 [Daphnia pulicaria]
MLAMRPKLGEDSSMGYDCGTSFGLLRLYVLTMCVLWKNGLKGLMQLEGERFSCQQPVPLKDSVDWFIINDILYDVYTTLLIFLKVGCYPESHLLLSSSDGCGHF